MLIVAGGSDTTSEAIKLTGQRITDTSLELLPDILG